MSSSGESEYQFDFHPFCGDLRCPRCPAIPGHECDPHLRDPDSGSPGGCCRHHAAAGPAYEASSGDLPTPAQYVSTYITEPRLLDQSMDLLLNHVKMQADVITALRKELDANKIRIRGLESELRLRLRWHDNHDAALSRLFARLDTHVDGGETDL